VRRRSGRGWLGWLGVLAGIYVGVMLLYAAVLKAADPSLFIEQIRGYKIFPALATTGTFVFLWVEVIVAWMLILQVAPRWSLLAFAALMLLFVGVTAYAWSQGNASDCGCFGRMASRPPKEVILEDLAYVAVAVFAFWKSPWISDSRPRWILYGVTLPIFLALPWVAPRLPIDSVVTPMRPGYSLETLAADDLKVPLGEGSVFVAFLGETCPRCDAALPMMAELTQLEGGPKVTGVFAGDRARKRAWALDRLPAFPLASASEKTLRQYYRNLPVFALLEDGVVKRIWWRRTPTADEVMREAQGAARAKR
jgi:hypothetical protein